MGLLYTQYKMFHFKDKIDSLPRELVTAPPPATCANQTHKCLQSRLLVLCV
ncbi:conserved hypothetical protein [Helicobacter cinaedi PAGU611]|uniref:Uncharacterized protein n=1 Tax=Helicobacter cinaedi CCUG 18818 = ATCC BAA-847 TaxID=537971 RepID=A0AAI8MJ51_9HELI|nr:hypothetical protein [Helicobacter cinaedi]BAM12021.1 conserved hypothetical protein [Helicobacter cinaedi PAGU611]BAM32462.1 conserved hypothetical protein [Helicobacter cinaedi CCUG 18818 = ATCC BAA-847]BBB19635.1 hypothetical protein HC081234_08120 [Helicobacter cinaedi]